MPCNTIAQLIKGKDPQFKAAAIEAVHVLFQKGVPFTQGDVLAYVTGKLGVSAEPTEIKTLMGMLEVAGDVESSFSLGSLVYSETAKHRQLHQHVHVHGGHDQHQHHVAPAKEGIHVETVTAQTGTAKAMG